MTEPQQDTKAKPAADEVARLDLASWKERARAVFDESEHAVHGALAGDNRRQSWTEEQVREALKVFRDSKQTPGSEPL